MWRGAQENGARCLPVGCAVCKKIFDADSNTARAASLMAAGRGRAEYSKPGEILRK